MTIVELEYPKIERIEGDERYAKFACEPLPPGYGTTLGNSLRRVLLSSLPGAAITAARVRGVAHEFSTIPGVKEDVVQLVLNLKQIRLRSFASEPVTLTLEKAGPGEATAADIMTTSEIEIVNPEAKIATLEPASSLRCGPMGRRPLTTRSHRVRRSWCSSSRSSPGSRGRRPRSRSPSGRTGPPCRPPSRTCPSRTLTCRSARSTR